MTTETLDPPVLSLDITQKQSVSYCIDLWLRDEQIRAAIARVRGRVEPGQPIRAERIALVGYGPSLADTWELLRDYDVIMTCSGAHKFLIDRGIVPTYHLDVDPRAHKATLIGQPHPDVEYLMASTCHPAVFDLLEGYRVKLWHIFDSAEEGFRILPPGEWALTGGAGAGLRMLALARCLGFTDQHIFGIDGSDGATGKHAGAHPSQAKKRYAVEYHGVTYYTTPAFLECGKAVFHELDAMPDVTATFFGEGLVQHMARHYVRTPKDVQPNLAISKPELISATARELNARLHRENLAFGVGGGKHAAVIKTLCADLKTTSVLDYGCGKGYLAKALPFPIWEYDPAIPEKSESPRPADLVVCTDVLEHVEDGKVQFVLGDIRRCLKQVGYFVIHMGPAGKTYADGRNTHLTQRSQTWWETKLGKFFDVAKSIRRGPELHVVVGPKKAVKMVAPPFRPAQTLPAASLALSFDGLIARRDPYFVGRVASVFDPAIYELLAASFPPASVFGQTTGAQNRKLTLGEGSQPEAYHAHLAAHEAWSVFHAYVKSEAFIEQMRVTLAAEGIALPTERLTARFEFSRLPADGGCLLPHTDLPEKVVTVVVSMRRAGDGWDDAWGGGTLILAPKPDRPALKDYQAPLEAFDLVETMPYAPNSATVFVRSDNSWHAVGPLTGHGDGRMRRSITINIERAEAAEARRSAQRAKP